MNMATEEVGSKVSFANAPPPKSLQDTKYIYYTVANPLLRFISGALTIQIRTGGPAVHPSHTEGSDLKPDADTIL